MEWTWNSNLEPQIIDKISRCEEEDMDEMYSQSQNKYMLKQAFLSLLQKTVNNYKEKRHVLKRKFDAFHAAPTQESTESIKAPSLNDMVIKGVMGWEHGSSPEPQLINKIIRCEELYNDVRSFFKKTVVYVKKENGLIPYSFHTQDY